MTITLPPMLSPASWAALVARAHLPTAPLLNQGTPIHSWRWRIPRQSLCLHRLEARCEVAQCGWLCDDPIPGKVSGVGGHLAAHRNDVVDVALRVGAPRDRQPDQVHIRRPL